MKEIVLYPTPEQIKVLDLVNEAISAAYLAMRPIRTIYLREEDIAVFGGTGLTLFGIGVLPMPRVLVF